MKNPLIKICGITSEEEIRYIAKAGIDYAGFVLFFPKSKRNLSLECAKKLIAKLPAGVVSVAVTVSPTKEQVEAVVEAGFLAIQIHGKVEDSVITSCRIPVFKAFNVSDMDAFSHYEEMDEVAEFIKRVAVDKENIKDEVREFMDQYTTVHYSFSQNEGYRFHKL